MLSVEAVALVFVVTALSSSRLSDILLRGKTEPTVDVRNHRHVVGIARIAFQIFVHRSEGLPDTIVADDSLLVNESLQRCSEDIVLSIHVNSAVVVRDHLLDVSDSKGGV